MNFSQNDLLDKFSGVRVNLQRCYGLEVIKQNKMRSMSAIDALEDTTMGLIAFESLGASGYEPNQYLRIYGVLQAIFVQQDALMSLGECIGLEVDVNAHWATAELRNIRRFVAGHPTNTKNGKVDSYCFIDRTSLTFESFQYYVYSHDGSEALTQTVNFVRAIDTQLGFSSQVCDQINAKIDALIRDISR